MNTINFFEAIHSAGRKNFHEATLAIDRGDETPDALEKMVVARARMTVTEFVLNRIRQLPQIPGSMARIRTEMDEMVQQKLKKIRGVSATESIWDLAVIDAILSLKEEVK